jgi:hypothetical protein
MKTFNFALIPIVVAALSNLTGCTNDSTPIKVCTDRNTMQRVEESKCNMVNNTGNNSGGLFPYYWYYMHSGYGTYGAPAIGSSVSPASGSFSARPGVSYGSVARGGFGSTASSFGGSGE